MAFKFKEFKEFKETSKEVIKDKPEKETKEHKEFRKEFFKEISKLEIPEYVQQVPQLPGPGPVEATGAAQELSAAAGPKTLEKAFKVEYEKHPKQEKPEMYEKHWKLEKHEYTEYVAGPVSVDPGGPVEQRLAAIEAALAQLVHFIPQELRPDLSKGALKQEPKAETTKKPEQEKK